VRTLVSRTARISHPAPPPSGRQNLNEDLFSRRPTPGISVVCDDRRVQPAHVRTGQEKPDDRTRTAWEELLPPRLTVRSDRPGSPTSR